SDSAARWPARSSRSPEPAWLSPLIPCSKRSRCGEMCYTDNSPQYEHGLLLRSQPMQKKTYEIQPKIPCVKECHGYIIGGSDYIHIFPSPLPVKFGIGGKNEC
uniref:Uncharacterized protein n=1 Tax=Esox lucius TaxID=8010 RepID=A0AAY5L0L7_ESOLU